MYAMFVLMNAFSVTFRSKKSTAIVSSMEKTIEKEILSQLFFEIGIWQGQTFSK